MRAATSLVALLCGVSLAQDGNPVQHDVVETCAERSRSRVYWTIDDFTLKVYNWDNGGSMGTFGFRSYYSATNKTVECTVQDVDLAKLGDGAWSKCGATGTEFRFNFADISLTMKETWACPELPGVTFHTNSTGSIMLHGCLNNDTEKGVESDCNLMELEMATTIISAVA